MKKTFLLFFLALTISNNAFSQELISSEFLESRTQESLQSQFFATFNNGVDMYKILYTTLDIHGQLDTASGMLVVPDKYDFIYPLLCYQHGTVDGRWDVPSELAGGYQIAMAFGGKGFATIAPDFLGLGEARGTHPYVHAASEASAAIDMLFAARQFAAENDFLELNDQLFISGYSQGGHGALAAHKYIQQDYPDDFTVTASGPMSGPYSVSEKMIDFSLADQEYDFVSYIAWTALSYNLAYGNLYDDLGEFFKADYVPIIEQFANEEIGSGEMNELLTDKLEEIHGIGQVKPRLMLQDSILDFILNDPSHPVSLALADNDLVDWVPDAPTRLVGCMADDQVTFQNAIFADSIMNANGAVNVAKNDVNSSADHGGCVLPAVTYVAAFFATFQEIGVSNKRIYSNEKIFSISPNPASDHFTIQLEELHSGKYLLNCYHTNGQLMYQNEIQGRSNLEISVVDWSPGIYLLQVIGEEGSYTQKVVVE